MIRAAALAALVAALGCSRPAARQDAGPADAAGAQDAGDAGVAEDAGPADAGEGDAGGPDAGASDAGPSDAGPADAGAADAGAADAGPLTFLDLRVSPHLAGDGMAVQISASPSRLLSAPPSLRVNGRPATLTAFGGSERVGFSFVVSAASDVEGDQPIELTNSADDGNGGTSFAGVLELSFAGRDAGAPDAGPDVLTRSNDQGRTGATLVESQLDTASVAPATFGKLFSLPVTGQVYAQPLYAAGAPLADGGSANVLFVATEHDQVYAFDADQPRPGGAYWQAGLGTPAPSSELDCPDLTPEIGITATPAIDRARGLIYVLAKSQDHAGLDHLQLHALDLATGAERLGGPVEVAPPAASDFQPKLHNGRAGLLLYGGAVWLALASHCDLQPYRGEVLAYDAATLQLAGSWTPVPGGAGAGIWQSGQGLSADESGVYAVTGNGTTDGQGGELGDSVVRLQPGGPAGVALADWFTPFNYQALAAGDSDLGSSGALLLPGRDLLLTAGKAGVLYLLRRSGLGQFQSGGDSQVVQTFQLADSLVFGSLAHWRGPPGDLLYSWGAEDLLKVFALSESTGLFELRAASVGQRRLTSGAGGPRGAALSLSAHGGRHGSGLLWATFPLPGSSAGVLAAYDAEDVSRELWISATRAGDALGSFAKFNPPTIAAGKVYVGTFSNAVQVYGLGPQP